MTIGEIPGRLYDSDFGDDSQPIFSQPIFPTFITASVRLVTPSGNDPQCVIQQRPLERLRLVPRRTHPDVALLICRQDHRHRLGMDRLDDRVRRCGEETVDKNRLRLGATTALELGPDAGEGEKRPILIQREPNDVLGPVYLRQQTFAAARWMSVLCQ